MAGNITVNPTGAKTVQIQTTGNEKNRFTVVLTCFADGSKFPSIFIFKEKIWLKNFPPSPLGVQVWFQDNGWMNEPNMMRYSRYWSIKHFNNFKKCLFMILFQLILLKMLRLHSRITILILLLFQVDLQV